MTPSIHRFETLDSTNTTARGWIQDGAPEGTVIVAERQSAGRGRDGRSWTSLPGALLFSILLRPSWPAVHLPRLGFFACLAGAFAAESQGLERGWLKWPNDLVFPTATLDAPAGSWTKWGGVLVETGTAGSESLWAIVGVGLNISSLHGTAPADVPPASASLSDTLGCSLDRAAFLNCYLDQFGRLYDAGASGWNEVLQEWRRRDILLGRTVRATSGGKLLSGPACGVNDRGALLVRTSDGLVTVEAGDVHLGRG